MNIKKTLLVAGAVTTVGLAGIGGVGMASAASNEAKGPHANLATKIAERFNLNQDDVEAVFEEEHAAREAEMKQHAEERLDRAVSDGTITDAQKAAILAKSEEVHNEMKAIHEDLKNETPEVRHAALKQHMNELKQWAEDNNLPDDFMKYLGGRIVSGHAAGPGEKMMFHHEIKEDITN